jgi:hypothetical protein
MSATQRRAFFRSLGIKSRMSTPTSGKKVSSVSGCRKKFMFYPLDAQKSERLSQNQIP